MNASPWSYIAKSVCVQYQRSTNLFNKFCILPNFSWFDIGNPLATQSLLLKIILRQLTISLIRLIDEM